MITLRCQKNTHDPVFNALELSHQYLHAWVLNHIRYSFMRWNVLRGVDLIVFISNAGFWHCFKCGHYKHLWLHPHEKATEQRINHHWPHIFTQPWVKICLSLSLSTSISTLTIVLSLILSDRSKHLNYTIDLWTCEIRIYYSEIWDQNHLISMESLRSVNWLEEAT